MSGRRKPAASRVGRSTESSKAPAALEAHFRTLAELELHQTELNAQNEELREAHAALTEARDRYFELWELAPVSYVLMDEAGLITDANLSATLLFGVQRHRLVGRPMGSFVVAACADQLAAFRHAVFTDHGRHTCELELKRPDERVHFVRLGAIAQERQPGRNARCLVVITDVTDLRLAEASISRLNRELARRVTELRILSRGIISLQEEERRRLARELHDETGQTLGAVVAELRALEETPPDDDWPARSARLRGLRERVSDALREVRRMSQGLHPAVLESCGLATAIERCAADFSSAHALKITTHLQALQEGLVLPGLAEINLYRIVQEALTNIAKHARARRGSIQAVRQGQALRLIVEDDGRGFSPEAAMQAPDARPGFGLLGMRERVGLLGGELRIESAPNRGTTIAVTVPITVDAWTGAELAPSRAAPVAAPTPAPAPPSARPAAQR